MRYAQRSGYTPAEQQRREWLRLQAAERFARGDGINEIARGLRVMPGSVRRWRRPWQDGGARRCGRGGRCLGYTVEGTWKLMRRHGWSCQVPVRQAMERRGRGRSVEGRGVAGYKSTARDLGAYVCFEDEAGQGLRPPKGRTWAPRGARPIVRVRGAGRGRVSIAGVACYRPGDRPHLFYTLLVYRRRKGEAKGFTWADYRELIIATHQNLSAPLVWCWDNLNIHLAPELADFAAENAAWLRVYQLPAYAPGLNPAEGIWSLLKRAIVNFAAADLDGLVRIVKRKLKKIQYRPHLIDGCLAATGLTIEPW
jgi:DDE superfamily endonuclease